MWLTLFLTVAVAQQTCYIAAGQEAASGIVPCGQGPGVASCCQVGDFCLEDSACWNENTDLSYLYGCTDPTYTDVNCPWKCGSNFTGAPYVGLKKCPISGQNYWICTDPPSNGSKVVGYPPPECLGDDEVVAFAGPSSLPPVVSLPTKSAGTSLWFSSINATAYRTVAGFTPSTTPTPSASKPVSVEYLSYPSTTPPTSSIPGPTASTAPHSGLSSGAKIGIGVGVGVGVGVPIITIALLAGFLVLRKRRRATKEPEELPITHPRASEKGSLSELPPDMRDPNLAELSPGGRDPRLPELPGSKVEAELPAVKSPYLSGVGQDRVIHEMPGSGPPP